MPYQRPPLSKAFLKDPKHDLLPLRPESFYVKNAIDLRLGAEALGDRRRRGVVRAGGRRRHSASTASALATGARRACRRSRASTWTGSSRSAMPTMRGALRDALHAASDVVVVGGGFIGLEIAGTARLLGKTVTVLEAADRLMGRVVAPEISRHFLALHRGWGSDIRLNTPVGGNHRGGRARRRGHDRRRRPHRRPTSPSSASASSPTSSWRARPASPSTTASSSTTSWRPASRRSLRSAMRLLRSLGTQAARPAGSRCRTPSTRARRSPRRSLGKREPYRAVPWFWSDQGDVKLQMVGLSGDATRSFVRGNPDERQLLRLPLCRRAAGGDQFGQPRRPTTCSAAA